MANDAIWAGLNDGRPPSRPLAINWSSPQVRGHDLSFIDALTPVSVGKTVVQKTRTAGPRTPQYDPRFGMTSYAASASNHYDSFTRTYSTVQDLTITIFFRCDSLAQYRAISAMSRSSAFVGLAIGSSSTLIADWDDSALQYNANSGLTIATGQWYLGAMTRSATIHRAHLMPYGGGSSSYANYDFTSTGTARSPSAWLLPCDAGATTTRSLVGSWFDLRIYTACLTDAEILNIGLRPWDLYRAA